jgi:YbbR domain-containing protein
MKDRLSTWRDALGANLGYKAVALFFATAFWVWVQSDLRITARARVALEWKVPEGMALVEPPLEQVSAEIEGVQAFVRALPQQSLRMVVDLERAREGDVSIDLTQHPVAGLPQQLTVLSLSPAQLRVTLDRLLKRRVTVMPATVGKVADGYRLAGISVIPERAEVSGAASVLRTMESVSTEEVDLGGLREDADVVVGLALRKGMAAVGRAASFTVHVDVEAIQTTRRFEGVPVLIRDARWSSPVSEVIVELAGPEETVAGLEPDQVSVMVNVPEGVDAGTVEARRGRARGARYEVVHGGGEQVQVEGVTPATIPLVRKE